VKGTLVHRALQLLLEEPPQHRTPATARECLARARVELATDPEFAGLGLDADAEAAFAAEAEVLVGRYFQLEDPMAVTPVGLELSQPVAIVAYPSEQSIRGLQQRTAAIWRAVERACEREDFRPRTSRLCDWCSFQAYCPAFGGDPAKAREFVATHAS